ncbi:MAG TPA: FAD-binding oxidoreductase, partial [Beutenbergiaceae bacterium]|nr:FAD-binding oxidoreductase [Beutenbergiaceae bacterium]
MPTTITPTVLDELRNNIAGEVDATARRLAEYSTDASNYRIPPRVVVFPHNTRDVTAITDIARAHQVPIISRGGGTSIAGNSIGDGIVIDFSRHMNAIIDIDPTARIAHVQPGVIMADLQKELAPHGLRFGPDPSTQNRATFGGMIGNNACGPRAVAFGRTADNVASLDVIDGHGRSFSASQGIDVVPGLGDLVRNSLATIRTEFGRFSRQVSGYSLEHLLPENNSDLAKFLVGTEGTLVTVTQAAVKLVEIPSSPTLVVLGYPSMPEAADAVPALLEHNPVAVEGF